MGIFENKEEMVADSHHYLSTIVERFDILYVRLGDCAVCVYVVLDHRGGLSPGETTCFFSGTGPQSSAGTIFKHAVLTQGETCGFVKV
jgi:hypothetical protein